MSTPLRLLIGEQWTDLVVPAWVSTPEEYYPHALKFFAFLPEDGSQSEFKRAMLRALDDQYAWEFINKRGGQQWFDRLWLSILELRAARQHCYVTNYNDFQRLDRGQFSGGVLGMDTRATHSGRESAGSDREAG